MSQLTTIDVEHMPIRVPADATTLKGFRAWATSDAFPDRGQISYIQGELWIDMSPCEPTRHNPVVATVTATLHRLIDELELGVFLADRTLISMPAADISTEPDAAFATW